MSNESGGMTIGGYESYDEWKEKAFGHGAVGDA